MPNPFLVITGLPDFALTDRLLVALNRLGVLGRLRGLLYFDRPC